VKTLVIGDHLSQEERKKNLGVFGGKYAGWFKGQLRRYTHEIVVENLSQFPIRQQLPQSMITALVMKHKPDLILLCGPEVTGVSGITQWENREESRSTAFDDVEGHYNEFNNVRTFVVPHPRDLYDRPHYYTHLMNTLDKAYSGQKPVDRSATYLIDGPLDHYLAALELIKVSPFIVFDIETPMLPEKAGTKPSDLYLRSIGWCVKGSIGAITPCQFGTDVFDEFVKTIRSRIADPKCLKSNHNIFFDLEYLDYMSPVTLRGNVHCTMQAEILCFPNLPVSLNACVARHLMERSWKGGWHASGKELRLYNVRDCDFTNQLRHIQEQELKKIKGWDFFTKRRMPLFEATFHMARGGFRMDLENRDRYRVGVMAALEEPGRNIHELTKHVIPVDADKKHTPKNDIYVGPLVTEEALAAFKTKKAKNELIKATAAKIISLDSELRVATAKDGKLGLIVGHVYRKSYSYRESVNISSPKQLKEVFEALNMPKVITRNAITKQRRTDSTGKNALKKILATKTLTDPQRELLLNLLLIKPLKKAISSYYNNALDDDGFFRCYFNNDGAKATGRSSSRQTLLHTGGNSQNFPAREDKKSPLYKYKFKDLVLASPGCYLYQADQSSAEAMIVAHLAECKVLLEEFKKPKPDSHRLNAKFIYEYLNPGKSFEDLPLEEQGKKRKGAKSPGHGFNYGMAPSTLQETMFMDSGVFVPIKEIEAVFDALGKLLPEIKSIWHARTMRRIKTGERWWSAFGRPLQFHGKESQNSLNELLALEPQGTIPELTNEMIQFCHRLFLTFPEFGGRVIQNGHDAVLVEVKKDMIRMFHTLFTKRSQYIRLEYSNGPFVVKWDASAGNKWGKMHTMNRTIHAWEIYLDFIDNDVRRYV
jgi:DNA polymerase I-like protein with 3'-5' exonuclease and polymerase domains